MTNESKLMQLRAGLITEGQYVDSIDEASHIPSSTAHTPVPLTDPITGKEKYFTPQGEVGVEDPNVKAIMKALDPKIANIRPIDTPQELVKLMTDLISKIKSVNKDALTDEEVRRALMILIQKLKKPEN